VRRRRVAEAGVRAGALLCALALGAARPAAAQTHWHPQLRLDNDAYNFWRHPARRTDEEYTNGVRASLRSGTAPWWGRFAAAHPGCGERDVPAARAKLACLMTTITLGQDIYTPNLKRAPFVVDGWEEERPYFGWLYLEGKAQLAGERLLRTTSLTLGVTGPPSLGHAMQSLFHMVNAKYTRKARGWETQIGFEPGIVAAQRFDVLALRAGPKRAAVLDLAPSAGIAVGNVLTSADAGGTLRVGFNLSHPWDPRAWSGRRRWELYALAGGRALYVARDMSLDGNTFNAERSVERVSDVREYQFGGGLRFERVALEYRAVTRSREYRTGPGHHTYSTMIATFDGWR
jgi:hypothetical protein